MQLFPDSQSRNPRSFYLFSCVIGLIGEEPTDEELSRHFVLKGGISHVAQGNEEPEGFLLSVHLHPGGVIDTRFVDGTELCFGILLVDGFFDLFYATHIGLVFSLLGVSSSKSEGCKAVSVNSGINSLQSQYRLLQPHSAQTMGLFVSTS